MRLIIITCTALLLLPGCYKDKGNYDYQFPPTPAISGLDSLYEVFIGDTLFIKPTVTSTNPQADLHLSWRIDIPKEFRDTSFNGPELKMVFNLNPELFPARLTITDSSNGMKYFHKFYIQGKTDFTTGMVVLSQESGISQLSFIKPDNTVYPRIYSATHDEDLAGGPQQVIALRNRDIPSAGVLCYWVTGSEGNDAGVQLDPNTLLKKRSLRYNFFDPPLAARPGYLESSPQGVLRGVVNGKLYVGSSFTYYASEVYGMFGLPPEGDYELYPRAAFNTVQPYFLGYDINRKQIVAFTNFGIPAYIGTDYQVANTTEFDPKNMGLELIYFQQINNNNCFAFGTATDGKLYELKFGAAFMGFIQLTPEYKRAFSRADLITPTTQWAGAPSEVFYFSSGDKIYRYNPLNQDITALNTDFGGKPVSMVKVEDNGNTLIAGVEGTVYFLDISPGKFGDVLKKIDGIPGNPIDVAIRQ
jgi:hypothetical protein